MKGENFNISPGKLRVLVAPLEWGLGHATRCIPIINVLIEEGCEVLIGAEGAARALLEKEFPGLSFLELKGYRMQYSRNKMLLPWKLLLQFPKMIRSIYNEHRWLKKTVVENSIDLVISDNRFGLYTRLVPCVYITHQLTIKTGNSFTEMLAQKIHYHFINKYTACWIPDAAGENNLAGELSHPKSLPKTPVHYLGPLSRFEKIDAEKKYDLAVIISGPEPQRTIFEELLLKQLGSYKGAVLFVRGVPANAQTHPGSYRDTNAQIEIHNHIPAVELNKAIQQSELVISRTGYTTVMDLLKLQQKAILIPTPGQTEQEYLGKYLMEKKIFYCVKQSSFSLMEDIKRSNDAVYKLPVLKQDQYKEMCKKLVDEMKTKVASV